MALQLQASVYDAATPVAPPDLVAAGYRALNFTRRWPALWVAANAILGFTDILLDDTRECCVNA